VPEKPRVSIVIPVRNGADYKRDAIDSALAQTYENCEVLVVNDGSNDGGETERIARSYGKRIRYIAKANGGVASALNAGIREMMGQYFSWLSHDDVYLPHKVQTQVEYLVANGLPANVIPHGNFDIVDPERRLLQTVRLPEMDPRHFRYYLTVMMAIHGCTALIPKSCFQEFGGFDESLKTTQDYAYWFKIAGTFKFINLPERLLQFRQHPAQDTNAMRDIVVRECNELYIGFIRQLSEAEITGATEETLELSYALIARSCRDRNYRRAARYAALKAMGKTISRRSPEARHVASLLLGVDGPKWQRHLGRIRSTG
jgi:hypothetical protein